MVYRCEIVVVIVHTIYIHVRFASRKNPALYIEASLNQQRFVNIKNIFMSEKFDGMKQNAFTIGLVTTF